MHNFEAQQLTQFIVRHGKRRCVVLTGAGCSTESGIPDYRGPQGVYRRPNFVPLTYQQFMRNDYEKSRYWLRSMLGYTNVIGAGCNRTHMGICKLQKEGIISHVLTQNVDGLHHLADHGGVGDSTESGYAKYVSSSCDMIEIHGNIHQVVCPQCGDVTPRRLLQNRLLNGSSMLQQVHQTYVNGVRPDGDFDAPEEAVAAMKPAMCSKCGGYLKPHVVLFGENVPPDVVRRTMAIVQGAASLVCLGTSLEVFSAYRCVIAAKEANVPVAIVTAGKTRADGLEELKLDVPSTAAIIHAVTEELLGAASGSRKVVECHNAPSCALSLGLPRRLG